ncbi:response regulator [Candidatus Methylospira mobilis]|uniref:Response regulator n=1 Tax=Candidatus Methylospira mobilis TaxID=1808979 RepID=A0A5Q0BP52_9GAMM|nr:response regulator [Candidatus Methylospira mobilis]QFY43857.1 response regulator [Candidatus Methylospira mobilis]
MSTLEQPSPFEILLLEDEPADANLVRIALRENKIFCCLHHVPDGLAGVEFLRRQGNYADAPRPDLILLDLNMPRMNGREFLAAVKADEQLKSIPVVVLTTSDVHRDVVASYQLGAAGYITKPVDFTQFASAINQLGNYWFALVQLPPGDDR